MKKIAILTDSTANLAPEFVKANDITVIPLNLHWDADLYRDGVNITPAEFYDKLAKSSTIPSTSQPTYGEFEVIFKDLISKYDAVIAVLISSGLSGTVDSALMAQKNLAPMPIEVIDSKTSASGLALLVKALVKVRADGADVPQLMDLAQRVIDNSSIFFVVDTLKYLHKGGRIGGASALLGGALEIKPILTLSKEGKIEALEKVRTKKKAVQRLMDLAIEKASGSNAHFGILHAQAPEEAQAIHAALTAKGITTDMDVDQLTPVIGTHVGPGTLGIAVHTVEY